ncbi:MAG: DinB family protein [Chloroflexi bacterium]|nr:DinB family protein [Chloroflexota bacterium]
MVALPEMRTLVERADAHRHVLEGLIASVPEDYWDRQAPDDAWTALDHMRHVATVDRMVVELLEAAERPEEELWAGGVRDEAALEARRVELMDGVRAQDIHELVATMRESREAVVAALLAVRVETLEREVRVAGVLTPWGEPHASSLRTHLTGWAGQHDGEHEAAIRRAIETPPDVTALTLAARRARGNRSR